MSDTQTPRTPFCDPIYIGEIHNLVQRINEILQPYSDKDWNYSRLRLTVVELNALQCPYLLGCELIDTASPTAEQTLKDVRGEVNWGDHHSDELGILEIISLRLNKALLSLGKRSIVLWGTPPKPKLPVIRLVKRQDLLALHTTKALWYEGQEVSGEDFDNR